MRTHIQPHGSKQLPRPAGSGPHGGVFSGTRPLRLQLLSGSVGPVVYMKLSTWWRQTTAENLARRDDGALRGGASMRPRQITAENRPPGSACCAEIYRPSCERCCYHRDFFLETRCIGRRRRQYSPYFQRSTVMRAPPVLGTPLHLSRAAGRRNQTMTGSRSTASKLAFPRLIIRGITFSATPISTMSTWSSL